MKTNTLVSIVSLASAAAAMNLSWAAEGHISIPSQDGQACEAGADSGDWIESWMPPPQPLDPEGGGCEDCTLSDTIVETYCESRGSDCDGLIGFNESYKWTREKYIYQCGTPGQPGYGWYVECSTWVQSNCCDDGSEGLPPTACTHSGAAACSSRN
jgi:hypothetical protein